MTHLTGDARAALENPSIEKVVVTDTLPITFDHKKLEVISIADEIISNLKSPQVIKSVKSCSSLFLSH